MFDIKEFPTAQEVRENNWGELLFEQELRSLMWHIIMTQEEGSQSRWVKSLRNDVREFLEEKGFDLFDENGGITISWEGCFEELSF